MEGGFAMYRLGYYLGIQVRSGGCVLVHIVLWMFVVTIHPYAGLHLRDHSIQGRVAWNAGSEYRTGRRQGGHCLYGRNIIVEQWL